MKILIYLSIITTLSGCGSTIKEMEDSIMKIGKDTYQLSQATYSFKSNYPLIAANTFCNRAGKEVLLKTYDTEVDTKNATTRILMTFLCLKYDDPRYTEANPQTKADITINKKIIK